MKIPHLSLCCGLLLLAGTRTVTAKAQPRVTREPAELLTEPQDPPFVGLDGGGKLLDQSLLQDGWFSDWYHTYVYYPRGSRRGIKLERDLSAMNVFLAAEVRRPRTVRMFFKEYFLHFLIDSMEEGAPQLIMQAGIDENLDDYLTDKDSRSASPARRTRLRAKLAGYARPGYPVVTGNRWTLDVYLIVENGAVIHWLLKGRMTPLQIDSFLWEPKEPAGSFKPLVLTNG